MVCSFAFAIVACGAKKEPETAVDTTAVEMPAPAPDTTVVTDTAAAQ